MLALAVGSEGRARAAASAEDHTAPPSTPEAALREAASWLPELHLDLCGTPARLLGGHNSDVSAMMVQCTCSVCLRQPPSAGLMTLEQFCDHAVEPAFSVPEDRDASKRFCYDSVRVVPSAPGGGRDQSVDEDARPRLSEYLKAEAGDGEGLVGTTVQVFWYEQPCTFKSSGDRKPKAGFGKWYAAEVVEFNDETGEHKLVYLADNDEALAFLPHTFVHFGKLPPRPGKAPKRLYRSVRATIKPRRRSMASPECDAVQGLMHLRVTPKPRASGGSMVRQTAPVATNAPSYKSKLSRSLSLSQEEVEAEDEAGALDSLAHLVTVKRAKAKATAQQYAAEAAVAMSSSDMVDGPPSCSASEKLPAREDAAHHPERKRRRLVTSPLQKVTRPDIVVPVASSAGAAAVDPLARSSAEPSAPINAQPAARVRSALKGEQPSAPAVTRVTGIGLRPRVGRVAGPAAAVATLPADAPSAHAQASVVGALIKARDSTLDAVELGFARMVSQTAEGVLSAVRATAEQRALAAQWLSHAHPTAFEFLKRG